MAIRFQRGRRPRDGPKHQAACKGIKLGKNGCHVVGMVVADPDGLPADGLRERLRQADAVRRRTAVGGIEALPTPRATPTPRRSRPRSRNRTFPK